MAGPVQRDPGIVSHAAVDHDVRAHSGDAFDEADGVQRRARGSDDGATRFQHQVRRGHLFGFDAGQYPRGDAAHERGGAGYAVFIEIPDAQTAAHVQFLGGNAGFSLRLGHKPNHEVDGLVVGSQLGDLGAYVAVISPQAQPRRPSRSPRRGQCFSPGYGDAELGIQLARSHVGVRVRGHPGRNAQEHVHRPSGSLRGRFQTAQLPRIVHDDAPYAGLDGHGQLRIGLVVAVKVDALRGKTGLKSRVQLAAGNDVQSQTFIVDNAAQSRGQQRLARVQDAAPWVRGLHRLSIRSARGAYTLFVQHVQGRAVLSRQSHGVAAADEQMALIVCGQIPPLEQRHRCIPPISALMQSYHRRRASVKAQSGSYESGYAPRRDFCGVARTPTCGMGKRNSSRTSALPLKGTSGYR